ncbi:MAG: hypothetical protein JWM27_497 [Gemmatimonadetes bacterium]|nr:hypothetical protein [Gemmatimonadota bacterium]
MRIAFLAASGETGGAERSLLDVAASLLRARPAWTPALVVPADGSLAAEARVLGVEVRVLPFPPRVESLGDAGDAGALARIASLAAAVPAALAYARTLRRTLAELRPDVVHSNGLKTHLLAARAAPRGVPLIWHMHDYLGGRPVMARLLRAASGRCAQLVANSQSVAVDARAVLGARVPIDVVHNAVDLARFHPDGPRMDLDAASGLPPAPAETVRVGLVATMGVWKGHDLFLRALALLPAELSVRGYVVGGGIYRTAGSEVSVDALRALAADLGLEARVGFTGRVDDAAAAMRALDVVVHASTRPEPFGLVIAEGMACGRAVVVSHEGGAAEIVRDGVDAIGFEPRDAASLADRMARLAADAGLRARLGAAAREAAVERFDPDRLAAQLVPVYARLTGGG